MRSYAIHEGLINIRRAYNKSEAFVFTVQTTGTPETFALPLEATGTYDFHVNWGDSTSDDIAVWNDAAATHSYASPGTHTITITGVIHGWRFNNVGDKLKIYDVKFWGPLRLGSRDRYFYGCSNLTVSATDILDVSSVTSLESAFHGCSSLTTLDVSLWDISNVTDFFTAFHSCSSLTTLDVSLWNTSSATTFRSTFYNCSSLTTLDVSLWDTSSVDVLKGAFHSCSSLTILALDNWDITAVTTMEIMLVGVTLTTINYSNILVAFEAQAVLNNVLLHGGNSQYSVGAAATARAALIADHSWTITDGGQA